MHKRLFFVIKALSIVGIILALFLLWEQLFHPSFQPCNISAVVNCDAVISGVLAKTLGLPTPLYGLIGYIVIFLASFFRKARLVLAIATFGLGFCLWIAYRELVELAVICPVCIACQIIMLTVFVLGIILVRQNRNA